MKQKLFISLFLILLVGVLAGLNAVSYVQKEKTPDNEVIPNRSSFNSGATGTQALYTLLSETGRKVIRWQKTTAELPNNGKSTPNVFVVIGVVRKKFTEKETDDLLRWVASGGHLVLIDREPPEALVTTTANWQIKFEPQNPYGILTADPSDQKQMIGEDAAFKPVQPTVFTGSVNAVQPSQFASSIGFERFVEDKVAPERRSGNETGTAPPPPPKIAPTPTEDIEDSDTESGPITQFDAAPAGNRRDLRVSKKEDQLYVVPSPTPVELDAITGDTIESPSQNAPVIHLASGDKNLLVDAPYGEGRITFLADPYIVSNGGISLVDNAQLAINILAAGDGVVAFDEYHQGYGANKNEFLKFFEGTPIVAMFFQAVVLIGLVFYSQSRRFARPVSEPEPDRLSKLEYVSAMAELQERASAYDLAIENIYSDFRRRAARLLGADNLSVKYDELAKLIAERTGLAAGDVAAILYKCEDIIRGEPTGKREVLKLSGEVRLLETKLGLHRSVKARI